MSKCSSPYDVILMKYSEWSTGSLVLFPCNAEASTALSWHKLLSMLPWRVTRDLRSARSINMHLGFIAIWWWNMGGLGGAAIPSDGVLRGWHER